MSKRKEAKATVVQVLLDSGFVADGATRTEHVRVPTKRVPLYGTSGGELATFGGRARFTVPGSGLKATVGDRTTYLYRVPEGGGQVEGLAHLDTMDVEQVKVEVARVTGRVVEGQKHPLEAGVKIMNLVLKLNTRSPAFEQIGREQEAARIIRSAAIRVGQQGLETAFFSLKDANDEIVGSVELAQNPKREPDEFDVIATLPIDPKDGYLAMGLARAVSTLGEFSRAVAAGRHEQTITGPNGVVWGELKQRLPELKAALDESPRADVDHDELRP